MKLYIVHPIRGKTGTDEEITYNLGMANKLATDLTQAAKGVLYFVEFYVPGMQDTFPQKAMALGLLGIKEVLEIDLAILGDCDGVIAISWVESEGVKGEIKEAKRLAKPTVLLPNKYYLEDLVKAIGQIRKVVHG
jgi:hypothetical protein